MAEEASHPVSYYTALSPSELRSEIDRETELLFGYTDQLGEAIGRRNEIREAMEKERTIDELRDLQRDREKRIERLRGRITELKAKIADERRMIAVLRRRISTLEARLPVPATRSNYFRLMRRIREFRRILRRYPPPSVVTKVYYGRLIEEHLGWMRNIRTLRTLYRRLGGYRSAISRWNATITSLQRGIAQYERWQRVRVETVERLRRLREELHPWIDEIIRLREQITLVEAELAKKGEALPFPTLYRIKIRLYNEERKPTPTGMFQGFFDIDALIDPVTELVNWDWWLTKEEIRIAKYHFVNYFKDITYHYNEDLKRWKGFITDIEKQARLAYFDEPTGIPYAEERVKYGRFHKKIPSDFIIKAQTLTVRELIVGESSVEPEPNPKPTAENMGVFAERFMVISADGVIKWDELRPKWEEWEGRRRPKRAWRPTTEMVKRVKEELGIA